MVQIHWPGFSSTRSNHSSSLHRKCGDDGWVSGCFCLAALCELSMQMCMRSSANTNFPYPEHSLRDQSIAHVTDCRFAIPENMAVERLNIGNRRGKKMAKLRCTRAGCTETRQAGNWFCSPSCRESTDIAETDYRSVDPHCEQGLMGLAPVMIVSTVPPRLHRRSRRPRSASPDSGD